MHRQSICYLNYKTVKNKLFVSLFLLLGTVPYLKAQQPELQRLSANKEDLPNEMLVTDMEYHPDRLVFCGKYASRATGFLALMLSPSVVGSENNSIQYDYKSLIYFTFPPVREPHSNVHISSFTPTKLLLFEDSTRNGDHFEHVFLLGESSLILDGDSFERPLVCEAIFDPTGWRCWYYFNSDSTITITDIRATQSHVAVVATDSKTDTEVVRLFEKHHIPSLLFYETEEPLSNFEQLTNLMIPQMEFCNIHPIAIPNKSNP